MLWEKILARLETELPEQQLNTWIRPLQAIESAQQLKLMAPNRFVVDWVKQHYLANISEMACLLSEVADFEVTLDIGSNKAPVTAVNAARPAAKPSPAPVTVSAIVAPSPAPSRSDLARNEPFNSNLRPDQNFEGYVEGKSNQIARAAGIQVAQNPGRGYNPLLIYGGTGLGKSHLMQAIGNQILANKPDARVLFINSERFVQDMINSLRQNTIEKFKDFYRSLDALLIDDIQFFAGKERSQEEFFHTFNSLVDTHKQIIITCDRFPKEIQGLEDRLVSRFGWGLTVAIEPPELETRVAILQTKADLANVHLPNDVAFFIAKRIRSNVRDLEGAFRRVVANSQFSGRPITIDFAQEALRDLISIQEKLITIENIQRLVADHYNVSINDLLSPKRNRSIARPRQIAMALAKDMTNHSLPEIGHAFGGRDHTTVLHACRKIKEMREEDRNVNEEYLKLMHRISS